jgi:hypothetical protein
LPRAARRGRGGGGCGGGGGGAARPERGGGGAAQRPPPPAARRLASELGTEHYERIYTADELIDWVPEVIGVIESFDPQLVHSSVPNLLVAKLASRHVKVVLIGEGADELFAGYAHYSEIEGHAELHEELVATIAGLHAGGLQRVDRVAGNHGLNSRFRAGADRPVELWVSDFNRNGRLEHTFTAWNGSEGPFPVARIGAVIVLHFSMIGSRPAVHIKIIAFRIDDHRVERMTESGHHASVFSRLGERRPGRDARPHGGVGQ